MTQSRPQPKPGILDIAAYVPGKSSAKGTKVHKLSSNESPIGASQKAIEAYKAAAGFARDTLNNAPRTVPKGARVKQKEAGAAEEKAAPTTEPKTESKTKTKKKAA